MNILIIGSDGFIGKNLVEFYNNKYGYNVTELDHKSVLTESNYDKYFNDKVDIIINCAGIIKYTKESFGYYLLRENTDAVLTFLQSAKMFCTNLKAFIHLGSSSEYGFKMNLMREDMDLQPRTMYEATKAAGTMLCQGFAREYDLPIVIVRPFTVYGKYMQEDRFIPTLYNSIKKTEKIKIYNPKAVHDYIYIDDFIKGIDILIPQAKDIKGEVVNLGTGIQTTNFDVYIEIARLLPKFNIPTAVYAPLENSSAVQFVEENLHSYDSAFWGACTIKARSLGFKAEISFEEGIKKYCEWRQKERK